LRFAGRCKIAISIGFQQQKIQLVLPNLQFIHHRLFKRILSPHLWFTKAMKKQLKEKGPEIRTDHLKMLFQIAGSALAP
jgi:hypothetical protein